MPVGQVTRSQVSSTTTQGIGWRFIRQILEATPQVGETITAVAGTIPETANGTVLRSVIESPSEPPRVVSLSFTPSHLRTRYTIQSFTISLPALKLYAVPTTTEAFEAETEIGWFCVLNVAGQLYIQELQSIHVQNGSVAAGVNKHAVINEKLATSERLEVFNGVEVVPGATFEVYVVPFMKMLKASGPVKELALSDINPFAELKLAHPTYTATVSYLQEYENRDSSDTVRQ